MTTQHASSLCITVVFAALVCVASAATAQGTRNSGVAPAPTPTPRTSTSGTAGATGTTGTAAPSARANTAVTTLGWTEQEYRLGAGDKLRIEVYGQPQLSQSLQVRPDGKITLPLIGDIGANGRTSNELRDGIATSLKEYVNNPVVTVIVQEATSAQIHVIGEVSSPGTQVLTGPTTVLQALAQAGGFKEFAKKGEIQILRRSGSTTRTIEFDYKRAVKEHRDQIFLQPGDTVVVP